MSDSQREHSSYESLAQVATYLDQAGVPSYLENTFISGDSESLRGIYVQDGLPGLLAAGEGWGDPSDDIDHSACYTALDQAERVVTDDNAPDYIKTLTMDQLAIRRRVVELRPLAE